MLVANGSLIHPGLDAVVEKLHARYDCASKTLFM